MEDLETITPNQSITMGLLVSTTLSLLAALVVAVMIGRFHVVQLTTIASLFAFAGVFGWFFPRGIQPDLGVAYLGVGLTNGDPNGKIYGPGGHWVNPVTDKITGISVATQRIDPDIVEVLAGSLDVKVDVYAMVKVIHLLESLHVHKPEEAIAKELTSATRLFVSVWDDQAIGRQKDLMGEYLMLSSKAAFGRIEHKFADLKKVGKDGAEKEVLTETAIKSLEENAGKFRIQLEKWGYGLEEVKVEDIKLPQSITDARAGEIALESILRQNLMKAENLDEMVAAIKKDRPELSHERALEAAKQLLGLKIEERVINFSSSDLKSAIENAGQNAAALADALIKNASTRRRT